MGVPTKEQLFAAITDPKAGPVITPAYRKALARVLLHDRDAPPTLPEEEVYPAHHQPPPGFNPNDRKFRVNPLDVEASVRRRASRGHLSDAMEYTREMGKRELLPWLYARVSDYVMPRIATYVWEEEEPWQYTEYEKTWRPFTSSEFEQYFQKPAPRRWLIETADDRRAEVVFQRLPASEVHTLRFERYREQHRALMGQDVPLVAKINALRVHLGEPTLTLDDLLRWVERVTRQKERAQEQQPVGAVLAAFRKQVSAAGLSVSTWDAQVRIAVREWFRSTVRRVWGSDYDDRKWNDLWKLRKHDLLRVAWHLLREQNYHGARAVCDHFAHRDGSGTRHVGRLVAEMLRNGELEFDLDIIWDTRYDEFLHSVPKTQRIELMSRALEKLNQESRPCNPGVREHLTRLLLTERLKGVEEAEDTMNLLG